MRIEQTDDIATCHALRRAVFIDEQGVSEVEEMDDLDADAVHLLVWQDGQAVGTARLRITGSAGKIGRICLLTHMRGQGLGAALVRASMDMLRTRSGVTHAVLGAQTHAIGFYEKLGFQAYGEIYDDAGIPHRMMSRPL